MRSHMWRTRLKIEYWGHSIDGAGVGWGSHQGRKDGRGIKLVRGPGMCSKRVINGVEGLKKETVIISVYME